MNDCPTTSFPVGVPKPFPVSESTPSTSELLILPDGTVLVHNLTPAFAALLSELNPADERMSSRARPGRGETTINEPPRPDMP